MTRPTPTATAAPRIYPHAATLADIPARFRGITWSQWQDLMLFGDRAAPPVPARTATKLRNNATARLFS